MPTSRATSPAISWARSASFAPMAAHASARSCAGTWDQASKAGRAAVTARSTSLASPAGIVPIPCADVVELAPRVRDRGLRVVAHPARAHLVSSEEPLPARALRHPPAALDERLEVVAVAPGRQAGRQREDRLGPGGMVQARLRLHPV